MNSVLQNTFFMPLSRPREYHQEVTNGVAPLPPSYQYHLQQSLNSNRGIEQIPFSGNFSAYQRAPATDAQNIMPIQHPFIIDTAPPPITSLIRTQRPLSNTNYYNPQKNQGSLPLESYLSHADQQDIIDYPTSTNTDAQEQEDTPPEIENADSLQYLVVSACYEKNICKIGTTQFDYIMQFSDYKKMVKSSLQSKHPVRSLARRLAWNIYTRRRKLNFLNKNIESEDIKLTPIEEFVILHQVQRQMGELAGFCNSDIEIGICNFYSEEKRLILYTDKDRQTFA